MNIDINEFIARLLNLMSEIWFLLRTIFLFCYCNFQQSMVSTLRDDWWCYLHVTTSMKRIPSIYHLASMNDWVQLDPQKFVIRHTKSIGSTNYVAFSLSLSLSFSTWLTVAVWNVSYCFWAALVKYNCNLFVFDGLTTFAPVLPSNFRTINNWTSFASTVTLAFMKCHIFAAMNWECAFHCYFNRILFFPTLSHSWLLAGREMQEIANQYNNNQ